jgi:hypothetical protein
MSAINNKTTTITTTDRTVSTISNPADGSANANPQAGKPISTSPRATVQGSAAGVICGQ